MDLTNSVALVTGANRGIGRHLAQQLLDRGAARVYAAARDPRSIDLPGVTPVTLDVLDHDRITALAAELPDVSLLVNNAGVTTGADLITGDLDRLRLELETNHWGPLLLIRAFAPVLAANGGGAVLNVLSRLSWVSAVGAGGYAVSKAAAWSQTNGVRLELAPQGTTVTGVYLSATDTAMMAGWDIPKNDPADVARQALDGVQAGAPEVIADAHTAEAKADLAREPALA